MTTSFDSLPPEVKEQILAYTDEYDNVSRVSKEWRSHVKTSKKIMQRELDRYFFFYAVWYDRNMNRSDIPFPYPHSAILIMLIFPIVTEQQFNFLLKHQAKNAQVGALEKSETLPKLFWDDSGDHYLCRYFTDKLSEKQKTMQAELALEVPKAAIGNTETLIERLAGEKRSRGVRKAIFRYLQNLIQVQNRWDFYFHDEDDEEQPTQPNLTKGPTFSSATTTEMRKLLQGEHKVLRDFQWSSLYLVKPANYDRLERFFEEMKENSINYYRERGYTGRELENKLEHDEELQNARESYATLSKSLFKPRWNFGRELKTKKDYKNLAQF